MPNANQRKELEKVKWLLIHSNLKKKMQYNAQRAKVRSVYHAVSSFLIVVAKLSQSLKNMTLKVVEESVL